MCYIAFFLLIFLYKKLMLDEIKSLFGLMTNLLCLVYTFGTYNKMILTNFFTEILSGRIFNLICNESTSRILVEF